MSGNSGFDHRTARAVKCHRYRKRVNEVGRLARERWCKRLSGHPLQPCQQRLGDAGFAAGVALPRVQLARVAGSVKSPSSLDMRALSRRWIPAVQVRTDASGLLRDCRFGTAPFGLPLLDCPLATAVSVSPHQDRRREEPCVDRYRFTSAQPAWSTHRARGTRRATRARTPPHAHWRALHPGPRGSREISAFARRQETLLRSWR